MNFGFLFSVPTGTGDKAMKKFFGFTFLGSIAMLLLLWGASLALPGIGRENGPLESLQAIFLAVTLAALLAKSPQWRLRPHALIGFFFCVSLLSMLLRELEFDRFALPGWLISLGDGTGRDLLLGLLWLAVLVMAVRKRRQIGGWVWQGLRSPWGWTILLGGGFYLLGALFDQKVFPLPKPAQLFWEEALETVAAFFIGVGVLRWLTAERLLAGDTSDQRIED